MTSGQTQGGPARQHWQRTPRAPFAEERPPHGLGLPAPLRVDGLRGGSVRSLDGVRDDHSCGRHSVPVLGAGVGDLAGSRLRCQLLGRLQVQRRRRDRRGQHLGSAGGPAPGGGQLEVDRGAARQVVRRGRPKFRSETGVGGSASNESWRGIGSALVLHCHCASIVPIPYSASAILVLHQCCPGTGAAPVQSR